MHPVSHLPNIMPDAIRLVDAKMILESDARKNLTLFSNGPIGPTLTVDPSVSVVAVHRVDLMDHRQPRQF